jgi:hypothetical protein
MGGAVPPGSDFLLSRGSSIEIKNLGTLPGTGPQKNFCPVITGQKSSAPRGENGAVMADFIAFTKYILKKTMPCQLGRNIVCNTPS